MIRRKKYTLPLLFILLMTASSCNKKIEPSWDVHAYGPILKSTLTVNDIVPDSLLSATPDDMLWLVYPYTFYRFSFNDLVNFPDTLTYNYLPPLGGVTLNPGQTFFDLTENTKMDFSGAQISSAVIREGTLVLEVNSTIARVTNLKYRIPSASKYGQVFEFSQDIPAASGTGPEMHTIRVDISGYTIDMRGPSGISSNILTNRTIAKLADDAAPVTLTDADQFEFNVRFEDMVIGYARGYFGSRDFSFGPDTSGVDIFDMITAGNFQLQKVYLNLEVENGFGVDLRANFDELVSINNATGHTVNLSSSLVGQTLNISRATEAGGNPVLSSRYTYNLDNSNMSELLENMPDKLSYKLRLQSNPLGNISAGNDFVYYGYDLSARLNFEVPLWFIANDLTLTDTISFTSGEYDYNPGSAVLRFLADNGFPFSCNIQFYLLNADGAVTDSLLGDNLVMAPPLDNNLRVISPLRTEFIVVVPTERLTNFLNTKKIAVVARFNTAGAGSTVKIYSNYKLDLKMCGDFNYLIQL